MAQDTRGKYGSRKKFIEDNEIIVKDQYAWSFVSHEKRFVIFALWKYEGNTIFAESWNTGKTKSRWKESRENIKLIENESYALKIFPQERDEKEYNTNGKTRIKFFTSILTKKVLRKKHDGEKGVVWYVEDKKPEKSEDKTGSGTAKPSSKRSPSEHKSTEDQIRKSSGRKVIAHQKHNKLQEKLYDKLRTIHRDKVSMEEDFIDVKVEEETRVTLYEVKIDRPISCINKELGNF